MHTRVNPPINPPLIIRPVLLVLLIGMLSMFKAEEYVPLPKGDVHKKKELVQDVTLHDLDVANARPQVGHFKHQTIEMPYSLIFSSKSSFIRCNIQHM